RVGWYHTPVEFHWDRCEPTLVLRRWVHPKYLFDCMWNERGVGLHECPLCRVLVEENDTTSDELRHCFAPRTGDEHGECRNVIITQPLLPTILVDEDRLGELADQEVVRFPTLGPGQIEKVPSHVQHGFHPLARRVGIALFAMEEQVDPQAHLLTLAFGHAQNGG